MMVNVPSWRRAALGVLFVLPFTGLGAASAQTDPPPPDDPPDQTEPTPPPNRSGQTIQGTFVPAEGSGLRIRGTAKLITGARGNTKLSVHASGLPADQTYPTWLHSGACADNGPAYRHDPNGPAGPPNELWASSDPSDPSGNLQPSASGNAKGYGFAPWTARPEARSVVIHSSTAGNPTLACADLQ